MSAEFAHHLDCEIADRVAAGMSPDDARRSALADFGGIEAIKEQARDARGGRGLEDLVLDVRYAARVLRRNPGHTLAAVLTFALGIGAVTAIVSLVYGILIRPLPYAAADRLVVVWERNIPKNRNDNVVSLDNFEAWRDRARSFASMAAVVPTSITLPGADAPERLVGAEVTAAYFRTLGVSPALGRDFVETDARDGLAVILSDSLWRRRFNADPSVIGRAVTMSAKSYTIAGVMPAGFDPPQLRMARAAGPVVPAGRVSADARVRAVPDRHRTPGPERLARPGARRNGERGGRARTRIRRQRGLVRLRRSAR